MAGDRFELTTSGLWAQRATRLLHPATINNIILAEEKGFEPLRQFLDLPVFKTGPFNQTWVFLHNFGAPDQTWTGTGYYTRRILSPVRLPIPPLRQGIKICANNKQILVTRWRFELQTPWLKVKCSTGWASESYVKFKWLPRLDSNQRNARVKVLCLTTWLRGNNLYVYILRQTIMVERDGVEPSNPKEQIYSLPRLTTSLSLHTLVPKTGIEPVTYWLQVSCSTRLSYFGIKNMVGDERLGLPTPCL